jgi:tetratricopeptide (TPR) repeat protein
MKAYLRLAAILAVTFVGAISAQANDYSAAGASAYVQSKDYQGLLRYATAWSRAEPNNADAWSYLGVVYGIYLKQPDKLNEDADAVGAISHAIKLNPNQPNYYNNLAAAYAEMARWQDAFNTLNDEEPLAERLNNAAVWYKLGNGYARLEQARPTVSAYQHAIRLNPNLAQAWTNVGTMLQWGGNVQGAENAYVQGSRLGDPLAAQDNARLHQALAGQAAAAKGSANYNSLDRIINQQAKQNLENQLHNEGTLNINDHLP